MYMQQHRLSVLTPHQKKQSVTTVVVVVSYRKTMHINKNSGYDIIRSNGLESAVNHRYRSLSCITCTSYLTTLTLHTPRRGSDKNEMKSYRPVSKVSKDRTVWSIKKWQNGQRAHDGKVYKKPRHHSISNESGASNAQKEDNLPPGSGNPQQSSPALRIIL